MKTTTNTAFTVSNWRPVTIHGFNTGDLEIEEGRPFSIADTADGGEVMVRGDLVLRYRQVIQPGRDPRFDITQGGARYLNQPYHELLRRITLAARSAG